MPAGIAAPIGLALTAAGTAVGAVAAFSRPKAPTIPPTPFLQQDQDAQQVEQQTLAREQQAHGLASTIGTPTGAGSVLNPATSQQKTLLGQ